MLSQLYEQGAGVKTDMAESVRWLKKAAVQGDGESQLSLGVRYIKGAGVVADPQTGVMWTEKAACQGEPVAQLQYGAALANGLAGDARPDDGLGWIVRAAEQGHVDELMTMGSVSYRGNFGDPDIVVPYKWFRLAVNMGGERAMQLTGDLRGTMTPAQIARAEKMVKEWTPKQQTCRRSQTLWHAPARWCRPWPSVRQRPRTTGLCWMRRSLS
jgi:TPR repeat protein